MKIIDSHIHCGIQNSDLPFELIRRYLAGGGIQGACLYAPVEDIYNRYDEHFEDSAPWIATRQRANEYVLKLQQSNENIFGYYFVWNDFRREELKKGYRGVKWHRHEYEPLYNYDDPRCEDFLQEIYRLQLPVVLEESFENTLYMLRRIDGRTPVIIPHMGGLNGGFTALFQAKIWDDETIFADTALATPYEMDIFLKRYGSGRLLFGSDFPFGYPGSELAKVQRLKLRDEDYEKVVSTNILKLVKASA
ncbi:MAG TPA: amidohydrolase family protein [Syntrophales bacterium]|nr:amidohydrolase family protein [Syntrophales bacterium]HRT61806.1 amidohydrolase family protein [Syntrophales bacterium]